MFVYCAYCETQKCGRVARQLEQAYDFRVIKPVSMKPMRVNGKLCDIPSDMMPGYLFLYAETELEGTQSLRNIDGFRYILKYGDGVTALRGDDERFALMLLDQDGVIGRTKVYQAGQRVRLCSGAFADLQAEIIKVDRRYNRMLVKIPFTHRDVTVSVGYEMVEELSEEDTKETA